MKDYEEPPKRDWYYWFLIAFSAYAAATHLTKFLTNSQPQSLVVASGAALLAIGLSTGWPLRRKGERISSMPRPRAFGVVLSMIGVTVFTVGGLWYLAAR